MVSRWEAGDRVVAVHGTCLLAVGTVGTITGRDEREDLPVLRFTDTLGKKREMNYPDCMFEAYDWIDHDGQGAPDLPPGTRVQVRFRDGTGENWSPEPWEYWAPGAAGPDDHWTRSDSDESRWQDDIVAYRVVQDEQ